MRASRISLAARAGAAGMALCAALILLTLGLARTAAPVALMFSQFQPPGGQSIVFLDPFTGVGVERSAALFPPVDSGAASAARSPDGAHVVRPQVTSSGVDLFVERADGALVRLTTANGPAAEQRSNTLPVWSPDSQWISFISTSPQAQMDVYLVRADGTQLRRLYANAHTPMPRGLRWFAPPEQPFEPWLALGALGILVAGGFGLRALAKDRPAG